MKFDVCKAGSIYCKAGSIYHLLLLLILLLELAYTMDDLPLQVNRFRLLQCLSASLLARHVVIGYSTFPEINYDSTIGRLCSLRATLICAFAVISFAASAATTAELA